MDSSTRNEINSIIRELKSIQSELYTVSNGVRKIFSGISEHECSEAIESVASDCGKAINRLYHL